MYPGTKLCGIGWGVVLALRLADMIGASEHDRAATYYVGLLMNTYCHADAAEQARWFGDDISFKGDSFELLDKNTAQIVSFIFRRVGSHGNGMARAPPCGVPGSRPEGSDVLPGDAFRAQCAVRRAYRPGYDHLPGDSAGFRAVGWQGLSGTPEGPA
jgi:hypothetical protein